MMKVSQQISRALLVAGDICANNGLQSQVTVLSYTEKLKENYQSGLLRESERDETQGPSRTPFL